MDSHRDRTVDVRYLKHALDTGQAGLIESAVDLMKAGAAR
jgi:hypothetical protein